MIKYYYIRISITKSFIAVKKQKLSHAPEYFIRWKNIKIMGNVHDTVLKKKKKNQLHSMIPKMHYWGEGEAYSSLNPLPTWTRDGLSTRGELPRVSWEPGGLQVGSGETPALLMQAEEVGAGLLTCGSATLPTVTHVFWVPLLKPWLLVHIT